MSYLISLFHQKFRDIEVNDEKVIKINMTHDAYNLIREEFGMSLDMNNQKTFLVADKTDGYIGMLWGADIQIIDNLPCAARFIGERTRLDIPIQQINDLIKSNKPIKLPKPFARFDNLEF